MKHRADVEVVTDPYPEGFEPRHRGEEEHGTFLVVVPNPPAQ